MAASILTSSLVFADFNDSSASRGGFTGEGVSSAVKTVEQIKSMWDDTWVTVKGNILKQLSKDEYLFKDSSGEIVVEIDSKYWAGVEVSSNDVVELSGEVDRKVLGVKLDVKVPVKKIQ